MPEIEIRPAIASDIPALMAIDPTYTSDFVWQMEIAVDDSLVSVSFREIRLPRSVRVEYPRSTQSLAEGWTERHGFLVALLQGDPVGYVSLMLNIAPHTAWVTDLVVVRRLRRQGIGSALLLAAQEWGENHACRRILLELQPKNHAAIHMAQKLGFDFCGYNDLYYTNHDIALFFARPLR